MGMKLVRCGSQIVEVLRQLSLHISNIYVTMVTFGTIVTTAKGNSKHL